MTKRKLRAGSDAGCEIRKGNSFHRPRPTSKRQERILRYVRAAFRPAWTTGWGTTQREACIAEAYLEAWHLLMFCDDDFIIKKIVNCIATPPKNHEAREGMHTPYFTQDDEGHEVAIPDLAGKGVSLNVDNLIDQIDADRLARQPVPEKARKYKLTPEELIFLDTYYDDTTDRPSAVRKRFERLKKKQRAYLTYFAGFMWLQLQEEARRKRDAYMSQKSPAVTE